MRYRAILPAVLAAGVLAAWTAQDAPKTTKEVMNAAHKGKDSMLAKITSGKGTDDEIKKLVAYYEIVAKEKPPMGDEASWKEKTSALLAAAKEAAEKKEGALDKLKKASDCKACHSVHKPK